MRIAALAFAVLAVIFLGHVLYQAVQFGQFALLSLILGLLAVLAAVGLRRRSSASA